MVMLRLTLLVFLRVRFSKMTRLSVCTETKANSVIYCVQYATPEDMVDAPNLRPTQTQLQKTAIPLPDRRLLRVFPGKICMQVAQRFVHLRSLIEIFPNPGVT
jgi:hypothetical protein